VGRQTRQQRRTKERRQQGKPKPNPKNVNWSFIAGIATVLAVAAFLAAQAVGLGKSTGPTQVADKSIDGILCGQETITYHVHAHLTILDRGQPVLVPNKSGFGSSGCLYWLHTHDTTAIIHIEAPSSSFRPTLGKFFDVVQETYGQALMPPIKAGEVMKVYVNQKPYYGYPRAITLLAHTTITIELGPPFEAPQTFNFGNL